MQQQDGRRMLRPGFAVKDVQSINGDGFVATSTVRRLRMWVIWNMRVLLSSYLLSLRVTVPQAPP
jgi:hypothetical protein